jgi:hypothetical protein
MKIAMHQTFGSNKPIHVVLVVAPFQRVQRFLGNLVKKRYVTADDYIFPFFRCFMRVEPAVYPL